MFAMSVISSFFAAVLLLVQQAPQRLPAPEYIERLEAERRVAGLQVERVVQTLKVMPGQRIADIGAGSGLFTRPLASATGSGGVVYAIDVDAELLRHVEKTARERGLTNVRTVLAAENDPKIPEPVDLIVIIDTLHHIKNQGAYLTGLRRYLKPAGRIAVIDFSETWPDGHEAMRYKFSDLEEWMRAAGYARSEKNDFLENNFFAVYTTAQSSRRYINLPGRTSTAPFSDGVLVGNTLYLAGRLGTDPKTGQIPANLDDEIRFLLDGFKAVLAEAGMTMNNLVAVQLFCTDLTLFDKFNVAYRARFNQNFPARAFIGSAPLLLGAHFEILGIAVKD